MKKKKNWCDLNNKEKQQLKIEYNLELSIMNFIIINNWGWFINEIRFKKWLLKKYNITKKLFE